MRRVFVLAAAMAAFPVSVLSAGPAVRQPVTLPASMPPVPFAVLQACRAVIPHRPPRLQFHDGIQTHGLDAEGLQQNVPQISTDLVWVNRTSARRDR
jgi:hypothetical protein